MRISIRTITKGIEFYITDGKNYYYIQRYKMGFCEVLKNNFTIGELNTADYKFSGNALYRNITDIEEIKTIDQFVSEVRDILKIIEA